LIRGKNYSVHIVLNADYLRRLAKRKTFRVDAEHISCTHFDFVKTEITERTGDRRAGRAVRAGQCNDNVADSRALCPHDATGDRNFGGGWRATALKNFEIALPIFEKLAANSPENVKRRRELEIIKSQIAGLKS
jgi:hypothetical protein